MNLNLRDLGQEYAVWDALLQLSLETKPTSYLEVGTRYGDSLLRVLSGTRLDRIVISDIWHDSYFGANNNGTHFDQSHKHVERMLTAMGYSPEQVTYLDGDSGKMVPLLDKRMPFDLVLVDGDHDFAPAQLDLYNCWPLVKPGGFLVFDDIQSDQKLSELLTSFRKANSDVEALYTRMGKKFGVGVLQKEDHAGETSKIRASVLPFLQGNNGIDIGSSRDPITRFCVAFDRSDYPEVTHRGDAATLTLHDPEGGKFLPEMFDWVYSSHCLEDFEDTVATLKEWLGVLRPGGILALYVPNPDHYTPSNTDHKHAGWRPDELAAITESLGCQTMLKYADHQMSVPGCPRYSTLVVARKPNE